MIDSMQLESNQLAYVAGQLGARARRYWIPIPQRDCQWILREYLTFQGIAEMAGRVVERGCQKSPKICAAQKSRYDRS